MIRVAIFVALTASVAPAHDVITTKITFSKEIARLINKRCATCHREGGTAFSLTTYEAARPWAKAIKEEVDERRMPPWQAVKGFSDFKDDRGLTQEEIELINDWVEGGAPEGEPKYLPAAPKLADWKDAAAPRGTQPVVVANDGKLDAGVHVLAIRPKDLKKGASVQVIATRPDGTIQPLLWIYKYNPNFARTYYYTSPFNLPPGTEIEMSPPDAGTFALYASAPATKRKSGATGAAR
jgi:hypothetical protein